MNHHFSIQKIETPQGAYLEQYVEDIDWESWMLQWHFFDIGQIPTEWFAVQRITEEGQTNFLKLADKWEII